MDNTSRTAPSISIANESQSGQSDRAAQLAAARQRAIEVRKQRAEEKRELKQQEKENDRLRLERVKKENEKLKKSIEKDEEVSSPKRAKVDRSPEKEKPSTEVDGPRQDATVEPLPVQSVAMKVSTNNNGHDAADFTQIVTKIISLENMFREEMEYKNKRRAEKDKINEQRAEKRSQALNRFHQAIQGDPAYPAYSSGMKKTRDNVLMTHVFGV